MTKLTWIFVAVFSTVAVVLLLSFTAARQRRELAAVQALLAETQAAAAERRTALDALQTEIDEKKTVIEELEKAKDAVAQAHRKMESEMRSALESKDVAISELQGNLTVNILDRVLFDSGEAALKAEGEQVLQKIASVLSDYPNRQIQVIGHTDNIPIRSGARDRYPSNWELSAVRATAAIRFLQETGGVDPKRLAAVAYGEHHPIADNSTPEGRARNRRIALVVLPERVAFSDVAAITNALPALDKATNSPPETLAPIPEEPQATAQPSPEPENALP